MTLDTMNRPWFDGRDLLARVGAEWARRGVISTDGSMRLPD